MKKYLKDQLESLDIALEDAPIKEVLIMIVALLRDLAQEITNMQFKGEGL